MDTLADWLAWQESLHPRQIDLGLARLRRVLDRTGWRPPPCPVITVGGTNGKGSTVALIESMLAAAGWRVGTFTSPHLHHYNERIRIAGTPISDASLMAAFARLRAALDGESLTFFEFNAAAALLAFETAVPDCLVLEVGMGGRLDAVNVVDADVAVVTSIGLDHCEWLGTTVEAIGFEKAGIFRAGRPALFGSRDMPESICTVAAQVGAPLSRLGHEFDFAVQPDGWDFIAGEERLRLPRPALAGDIQYANAATAVAALGKLAHRLSVSRDAMARGLRQVRLSGRFEVQAGPVTWIFDVAHNPAAAVVLADALAGQSVPGRTWAVCGILGDKDVRAIVTALAGRVDGWFVAGLSGPRAVPAAALAARVRRAGAVVLDVAADVAAACSAAQAMARPGDRVVVFGSFLTVAAGREWWFRSTTSL